MFPQFWIQSHVSIDWNHFQRWNGRLQFPVHDQWVWSPALAQQLHPTRCDWSELSCLYLPHLQFRSKLVDTSSLYRWIIVFPKVKPIYSIITKMSLDTSSVGGYASTNQTLHCIYHRQKVHKKQLNIDLLSSYWPVVFISCRQEATVFHVSYYHLWQRKQSEDGCRSVWGHKDHHSYCLSKIDVSHASPSCRLIHLYTSSIVLSSGNRSSWTPCSSTTTWRKLWRSRECTISSIQIWQWWSRASKRWVELGRRRMQNQVWILQYH